MPIFVPLPPTQVEENSVLVDLLTAQPVYDHYGFDALIQETERSFALAAFDEFTKHQNHVENDISNAVIVAENQVRQRMNEEQLRLFKDELVARLHEEKDFVFGEEQIAVYKAAISNSFRAQMLELYQSGYYFENVVDHNGVMQTIVRKMLM
jgi:hypothetical protein